MEAIINVRHEIRDGWHIFTSPDLRGLFITGPAKDIDLIYESLSSTIAALIESGWGGRPLSARHNV